MTNVNRDPLLPAYVNITGSTGNADVNIHDGCGIPLDSVLDGGNQSLFVYVQNANPLLIKGAAGVTITSTPIGANEALDVNIVAGGAGSNSEYVDDSLFLVAIDQGTAVGGVRSPDQVDLNDFGVFRITENRELMIDISGQSLGSISVDDGGGALTVNGTIAATQSGNWNSRTQDGLGIPISSETHGGEMGLCTHDNGQPNDVTFNFIVPGVAPPTQLPAIVDIKWVIFRALSTNAAPMYIGNAGVASYELVAGESTPRLDTGGGENLNSFWAMGAAGDRLNYIYSQRF